MARFFIDGKDRVKQLPFPRVLVTLMFPPNFSTMDLEIARPKPVPLVRSPFPESLKKGSKMRFMFSLGMPLPLSLKEMTTRSFLSWETLISILPPLSIALMALSIRFMATILKSAALPRIRRSRFKRNADAFAFGLKVQQADNILQGTAAVDVLGVVWVGMGQFKQAFGNRNAVNQLFVDEFKMFKRFVIFRFTNAKLFQQTLNDNPQCSQMVFHFVSD